MFSRAGLRATERYLKLPKLPKQTSHELRFLSSLRTFHPPATHQQRVSASLGRILVRSPHSWDSQLRYEARRHASSSSSLSPFSPSAPLSARTPLKPPRPPLRQRIREPRFRRRLYYLLIFLLLWAALSVWLESIGVPRPAYAALAIVRTYRVMQAVSLDIYDYKTQFAWEERQKAARAGEGRDTENPDELAERRRRRRELHKRAAGRIFEALKKNSGIYVKLGQHVAAVQLLPPEWTETMKPLQDQCFPTPLDEIDRMLRKDLGKGIDELFESFSPIPIGVASLAQVHRAIDRPTGRPVAVKLQHPPLQEFADIDMRTVNFAVWLVKRIFPSFEFTWLAEEMNEFLPIEMDFRCEAANAQRTRREFEPLRGKTSLYVPEVLWAEKRCEVMEYIPGARIDDLQYLKDNHIDRNQVSQELSRIFSQMVYLNGYFHADPHHGNLLIRPRAPDSSSPYNFDVCLLDHGQYFDVPDDLRVDYARFWLSLVRRNSAETTKERKKWAKRVGNIDDDMYPILESAITGRINMADASQPDATEALGRPKSLLDKRNMGENEVAKLRTAMMEREGLILSIFELLRRVPRRLLMILKLSDLQRSLDLSLHTTHGQARIFMIVARYCAEAAYRDDLHSVRKMWMDDGLSWEVLRRWVGSTWEYVGWRVELGLAEGWTDVRARGVKVGLWVRGLGKGGWGKAREAMAGLT